MPIIPKIWPGKLGKKLKENLSHSTEEKNLKTFQWNPRYIPETLTHIKKVFPDGKVDIAVAVYFPKSYSAAAEELEYPKEIEEWCVQVKVNNGNWQNLNRPPEGKSHWYLDLEQVTPESKLLFRYKDSQGNWKPLTPLGNLDIVYGTTYVPHPNYQWQNDPPKFDHAKVLMETTLEGLLAGYKDGKFAPRSIGELFQKSISQRILKTDIPGKLADWGIDEIMAPVCSSVADRSNLNPKFNYLTYHFVNLDWQIGSSYEFKKLIDKFYENKIQLVPDLIFAHQVKSPFEGSIDQMGRKSDEKQLYVDEEAFLFRDYGTWMFNFEDPAVRRILVEKIVAFIAKFRLKMIRIDYIDGLILQYSNRSENYSEHFINELKAEFKKVMPELITLGETFEVANNPSVKNFIDVFYAPIGFSIVEDLYKPPSQRYRPLYPDIKFLESHLNEVIHYQKESQRREASYAQLHDETWYCQHIVLGRPYVPWAYGGNPAQLAKNQGEELIRMGLLKSEKLLDFVRRSVRNVEGITLFSANLRYMFVPTVDSLSLGCLDESEQWKVVWEGILPSQMAEWKKTGLDGKAIYKLHQQHRDDMVKLRQIFRKYSKVNEETNQPMIMPEVYYTDSDGGILGLFRCNSDFAEDSLVVVFNFGPDTFENDLLYELPLPEGFYGKWEVLFDGDWIQPENRLNNEKEKGYKSGTILEPVEAKYSNKANVLNLRIGAMSLIVLKYKNIWR